MSLPQVLERRVTTARAGGASRRKAVRALAAQHALFAVVPVVTTLWMITYSIHKQSFAIDFDHEFWPAAHRLMNGLSPYDRTWMNISGGVAFPYPALTAVAFVPLALLGHGAADWAFTASNIAAALLALWLLNVRDWRLFGLALILWPVVLAWQAANLTLVLVLGIAVLWRRRDHPLVAGLLVAVMISLKPFIWPLALWLLGTRRYRALAYAVASGLVLNLAAWTIVGWNQIHAYTALTSAVNRAMDHRGYSVMSLVMHLGGSRGLAYTLGLPVAAAVAISCLVAGRRDHTRAALTLAIAACLLATPVLWTHYFALLLIPLALYRPRLDRAWLPLLLVYACPGDAPRAWQIALALVTTTAVISWLILAPDSLTSVRGTWFSVFGPRLLVDGRERA